MNAKLEDTLSEEAEYLLASEAANAGCVVLSRSQDASPEEIAKTRAHLNCALQAVHCSRQFGDEIIEKNWEDLRNRIWNGSRTVGIMWKTIQNCIFRKKKDFSRSA